MQIVKSGFKPDFLVALWRGGASIGVVVHELLMLKGIDCDHIAIRTSKYSGVDKTLPKVLIHNLAYLIERVQPDSTILIVDDVADTFDTIVAFKEKLFEVTSIKLENVKVATVFHKPSRNRHMDGPDYYTDITADWLVFPHEVFGLESGEIRELFGNKIADLIEVDLHTMKVSEDVDEQSAIACHEALETSVKNSLFLCNVANTMIIGVAITCLVSFCRS